MEDIGIMGVLELEEDTGVDAEDVDDISIFVGMTN